MSSILAISITHRIEQYGAYAGLAAVLGLAVLSLLYFAQAREVKRLREWAGRAPERAAEVEARVIADAQKRVVQPVAQPQPRPAAATPAAQQQPAAAPAATPAAAAAATAAGAAAAAQQATTVQRPGGAPAAPAVPGAGPAAATAAAPAPATSPANGTGPKEDVPAPGAPAKEGEPPKPAAPGETPDAAKPGAPSPAVKDGAAAATAAGAATAAAAPKAPPAPPARPAQPLRVPSSTATPPPRTPADRRTGGSGGDGGRGRGTVLAIVGTAAAILIVGVIVLTGVLGGSDKASTPAPNTITQAQSASGAGTETTAREPVRRGDVTVAVLNGTTVPGLARGVANKLQSSGFKIGNVTNAADQSRSATLVQYGQGRRNEAREVARLIGVGADAIEALDSGTGVIAGQEAAVVVTVGADQNTTPQQ